MRRMWMSGGVMLAVLLACVLVKGANTDAFIPDVQTTTDGTDVHLEDEASLTPVPMPRIKKSEKSTADTYTGTGDLDVTMSHGQTITLYFDIDKVYTCINSAKLVLYMWDVDYPCATEQDNVYFNGSYLGRLEGLNQGWDYNYFDVPTSKITVPSATGDVSRNTVTIDVSVDPSGWVTRCGLAQLIIDGDTFSLKASRNLVGGISVNWDKAYGSYDLYRKGPDESDFTRIRQGITTNGCFDTDVQIGKPYAYYATQGGAKATVQDGASSMDVGLSGLGDLPRVTLTGMSPIIIGVTTNVKLTLDIQAPNRYKDIWDLADALKESHVEADAYYEGSARAFSPRFDFDDASPMSDGKTVRAIYTVSTKDETFNIFDDPEKHGRYSWKFVLVCFGEIKVEVHVADALESLPGKGNIYFKRDMEVAEKGGKKVHAWFVYWKASKDGVCSELTDDIVYDAQRFTENTGSLAFYEASQSKKIYFGNPKLNVVDWESIDLQSTTSRIAGIPQNLKLRGNCKTLLG